MKKILLLVSLLSINFLYAQENCGYLAPSNYSNNLNESKIQSTSDTFCINIFFHIVRETNQSNGFNPANLDLIIEELNNTFNR